MPNFENFLSARTDALHRLGASLPGAATAEEALKLGRLSGWNVRKVPAECTVAGKTLPIPNRFATVRDNPLVDQQVDVLGAVGKGYQVVQHEDLVPLLDRLQTELGATFDTAGEIDEGRRAFISMKMPGAAKVGTDKVENHLVVLTSHDGSTSTQVMVTPVRVANRSTLNLAFKRADHLFRVQHTTRAEKILAQQAREALEFTFNYLDSFQEEADQLLNTPLAQGRFEELIQRNFGAPKAASPATLTRTQNKLDHMAELFSDSFAQEGIRGTAWAGLNALTEWYDHYSPVRGGDDDTTRGLNALLAPGFKNKALKMMMELV